MRHQESALTALTDGGNWSTKCLIISARSPAVDDIPRDQNEIIVCEIPVSSAIFC